MLCKKNIGNCYERLPNMRQRSVYIRVYSTPFSYNLIPLNFIKILLLPFAKYFSLPFQNRRDIGRRE